MISTDVLIGQDTILAKQASRQSDDHDLRVLTFSFMGYRDVAEFGIGLAVAVALDAFILRTVLVPAAMHLFGDALLTRAGFSGPDALHIYRALFGFLHGHVLNELQELIENPDETDDLLRLGLHRLPIREFPCCAASPPSWPPTTAPPNSSAASTSSSPA